jgi:voltage-gated potassium channel
MKSFSLKSFLTWNSVLIVAIFLCSFVIPVFPSSWGRFPTRLGFTLIFISGVLSMDKRRWYILYLSLAALAMEWISGVFDWEFLEDLSKLLNLLFFLFVMGTLIRQMATPKVVNARVILASISGYLLMGIIFSMTVAAIIQRDPAAFNIAKLGPGIHDPTGRLSESIYYGFVTMATLGYGDIVPLKPYTRSLATLIAISGQLYIATIIGILIGKMASLNKDNKG